MTRYTDMTADERRAYNREWAKANPDRVKEHSRRKRAKVNADPEQRAKQNAYHAQRRADNPERYRAANAKHRANNIEKRRLIDREQGFKKRYGMTIADRDAMLAAQGGVCKSCGSPEPGSKLGWHIDHCHGSGKVRAVLCSGCNVALGHAKHCTERLRKLIAYLEAHQ